MNVKAFLEDTRLGLVRQNEKLFIYGHVRVNNNNSLILLNVYIFLHIHEFPLYRCIQI